MSDEKQLERENEQAEKIRQHEIAAIANRVPKAIGKTICDCGELVGDARRRLGYSVCIDCAFVAEVKASKFSTR